MEGEGTVEVAAEDASSDAKPVDNQGTASPGMYNPNVCWRCGQVGHFARDCKLKTLSRLKLWVGCITRWKRKHP